MDSQVKMSEKLVQHINNFKKTASDHAIKIIEKMHDPNKKSSGDKSIMEIGVELLTPE